MFENVTTLVEQNAAATRVLPALFLLATFDVLLRRAGAAARPDPLRGP